jgi:hypothetical protein
VSIFLPLALSVLLTGCLGAYQARPDAPRAVGALVPNVEDRDAGLVAVAPGFDLKAYRLIAVNRFAITDATLTADADRGLAQSMTVFLQSELTRRLRESELFERVINLGEGSLPAGPALRVDGDVTRLGLGARGFRALTGLYGAGRRRAQLETRFVDVATGRVVMLTAHHRVASAGLLGGEGPDHLREALDHAARDLARFLVRLSRGEAPRP